MLGLNPKALILVPKAQAVELLNGTWNLAYTSNSELSQLLSLSRLPFLTVGPIQQIVDTGLMTAQNKV